MSTTRPAPPIRTRLRLANVLSLYLVRLRSRWIVELLATLGLAVGAALLFQGSVATTSLSGPVRQLNHGIVGNTQIQLVARSPEGFSEAVYRQVSDDPDVKVAAPVLQVPASIVSEHRRSATTIYGSDPKAVDLRGKLVRGFSATELAQSEAIAVTTATADDLDLHTGDLARLLVGGSAKDVGIVVLGRRDIGKLADTKITLAPLTYLQALSGLHDRVSRVLVQVAPGRLDEVRARLKRLAGDQFDLRPGDYEPELFDKTARPTSQATQISSVLSALVGFLFGLLAMLVNAPARRALAEDLRRTGFSGGQIVQVLLLDALILGAIAGVLGLGMGDLLSQHAFVPDVGFLSGAFPIGDERIVTWPSVLLPLVGSLIAATVGVLVPVRAELRWSAHRARGHSMRGRRGAGWLTRPGLYRAVGVLLLALAATITVAAPEAALGGLVALTLAVALLTPAALDGAIVALRWLSYRTATSSMPMVLAAVHLAAPAGRLRSLAIATTCALAVFVTGALEGAQKNLQHGLDHVTVAYDHAADLWASPYGPGDLFAVSPIAPTDLPKLAGVQEISHVLAYRGSFLDLDGSRVWVRAPAADATEPIPDGQVLDGSLRRATASFRSRGSMTMSRAVANGLGLTVGSWFTLPTPRPIRLRISAITTNLGWPGGAIMLNADDYATAWGSRSVSAYQLKVRPGTPVADAAAAVGRALGPRSALRVETATSRDHREMKASRAGLARLSQVASLTQIAVIIVMAAAMAGLLWQQRGAISRQKLDGLSTSTMWAALAIQSAVLFASGCLLGGALALLGQVLFSRGLQTISGFPVETAVAPSVAVVSALLVTVCALIIVAVPGWLVARVRPSLRGGD